ncbi:hypothetical protein ANN_10075 [Periplaneta americana]|uniref:Per a allergen n=1 Tax=Periplaneta americana TaxID=6978 RepID=A0ABQ8TN19_PERAM|nr:hypothetical protein ANN_10075 [Periplaneta americana]
MPGLCEGGNEPPGSLKAICRQSSTIWPRGRDRLGHPDLLVAVGVRKQRRFACNEPLLIADYPVTGGVNVDPLLQLNTFVTSIPNSYIGYLTAIRASIVRPTDRILKNVSCEGGKQ